MMDAEETEQLAQLYESKMEDAEYGHQEPWEMAAKIAALEAEVERLKLTIRKVAAACGNRHAHVILRICKESEADDD